MNRDAISDEIKLADNECCIIFDFGCYFPYANFDVLTFDFSLGMEEFDDYKKNHRYPNKGYQTISKKYGRKVSKLGYPFYMKLDEQSPMILCIKIGIDKQFMSLLFPLKTSMTKDKPICGLSFHYNFDKHKFSFISHKRIENGGWQQYVWRNSEVSEETSRGGNDILLNASHSVSEDKYALIYSDVIEPCSSSLSDIFLLN